MPAASENRKRSCSKTRRRYFEGVDGF